MPQVPTVHVRASVAGAESGLAGAGSAQARCLALGPWVYWLPWGPVRLSLEVLWIRKHAWACLGPQPACPLGGPVSHQSSFSLLLSIAAAAILSFTSGPQPVQLRLPGICPAALCPQSSPG